jgi:hypothetical protein
LPKEKSRVFRLRLSFEQRFNHGFRRIHVAFKRGAEEGIWRNVSIWRSKLLINVLSQRLFIPCFLQFPASSAYIITREGCRALVEGLLLA